MSYINSNRMIHFDLKISRPDGETWESIAPWVTRCEIDLGNVDQVGVGNSGTDGVVKTLSFTLINDGELNPYWDEDLAIDEDTVIGDEADVVGLEMDSGAKFINLLFNTKHKFLRNSFHPKDKDSDWNIFNSEYSPLLYPNREVSVLIAITDIGQSPEPSDWQERFRGYLGDSIRSTDGGHKLQVECRDKAKRLQDTYLLGDNGNVLLYPKTQTDTATEIVLQDILDDNGLSDIIIYTPSGTELIPIDPTEQTFWDIPWDEEEPLGPQYASVWDILQGIVTQVGWFLGYRWHEPTDKFQLVLMKPPREKETADISLDWKDDFYSQDLDISDADIRNYIKVFYRNKAASETAGELVKSYVEAEDIASQTTFWKRAMQIELADTDIIKTEAQAQILADAAISDLSQLQSTTKINMPLSPNIDIFSTLEIENESISTTIDFYAVQSIRHSLDFDGRSLRTELVCSGKVTGGQQKWLKMQTRPGAEGNPINPNKNVNNKPISKPTISLATPVIGGILVQIDKPLTNLWDNTEIHISTTENFEISYPETLKEYGRRTTFEITEGFESGITYYIKAINVDFNGLKSAPSEESSSIAGVLPVDQTRLIGNLDIDPITEEPVPGTEKLVLGYIGDKSWKGEPIPFDTYGIWVNGNGYFDGKLGASIIEADSYKDIRSLSEIDISGELDSNHPLVKNFFIPEEYDGGLLDFRVLAWGQKFRATSTGAADGGASIETSGLAEPDEEGSYYVKSTTHQHGITNTLTGAVEFGSENINTGDSETGIIISEHSEHYHQTNVGWEDEYTTYSTTGISITAHPSHSHSVSIIFDSTDNWQTELDSTGISIDNAEANISVNDHSAHYHKTSVSWTNEDTSYSTTGISISYAGSHSHTVDNHNHSYNIAASQTDTAPPTDPHSHIIAQSGATSGNASPGTDLQGSHFHPYSEPNTGDGHKHQISLSGDFTSGDTIDNLGEAITLSHTVVDNEHSHNVTDNQHQHQIQLDYSSHTGTQVNATNLEALTLSHPYSEPNTNQGHRHQVTLTGTFDSAGVVNALNEPLALSHIVNDGEHWHSVIDDVRHQHEININHWQHNHYANIAHSHTVDFGHSHTIPDHIHGMVFGIYEEDNTLVISASIREYDMEINDWTEWVTLQSTASGTASTREIDTGWNNENGTSYQLDGEGRKQLRISSSGGNNGRCRIDVSILRRVDITTNN